MREESRLPVALRALRHGNYRLFLGGQLISLVGTWMQIVAESWLMYRLTGSAALLGMIGFVSQIPTVVLTPVGGLIADKGDRRRILLITQCWSMVLAFTLAGLTLTHRIQVWHIFVLAILLGIGTAFDLPTRQAFVVEMVGREDLPNAIALNSSMFNGARIVGPAIAGLLVGAIGEGWCFFINAASYVAAIGVLLRMQPVPTVRAPQVGSPLAQLAEGFRFAFHVRPIRGLLLVIGLIGLMGSPYGVLMPIFAKEILHGGPNALGLLMGASGVGALGAALGLAARQGGVRGMGLLVAIFTAVFGASLILFSLSRSFWLSAFLLVPVGYAMMIPLASSNTLVQAMVPDELRGRVMAFHTMMFLGTAPFGALIAGALAERIGAPHTVALGGAACMLGAALFALRLPGLRAEAQPLLAERESEMRAVEAER